MPLARSVARKFARWAIPKLESLTRLPKPVFVRTFIRKEPPVVFNLVYRYDFPNSTSDVARSEYTATIDGGTPTTGEVPADHLLRFPEGSHVRVFFVTYDAKGNPSVEPSDIDEFDAVMPDVTGPDKPIFVRTFIGREEVPVEIPAE